MLSQEQSSKKRFARNVAGEGFEIGRVTLWISKLLMHKEVDVPCNPPKFPFLPPDLPPALCVIGRAGTVQSDTYQMPGPAKSCEPAEAASPARNLRRSVKYSISPDRMWIDEAPRPLNDFLSIRINERVPLHET